MSAQSARAPLLCIKNVPPPPKTTHDFLHHPRVFPQPPFGSQHVLTRLFLRGLSLHAFAGLAALLQTFLCSPEPLGPGMLSPWQGWAGTRSIVIFPSVLYSSVRVPGPSVALGTAPMAELVPALLLLAKNHRSHRVWPQASEQQGHGERESAAGWGWRGSKHAPSCLTSAWEGVDEHGGMSAAMRQE